MPQTAERVIDHEMLFREPEYKEMLANKKTAFEFKPPSEKIEHMIE